MWTISELYVESIGFAGSTVSLVDSRDASCVLAASVPSTLFTMLVIRSGRALVPYTTILQFYICTSDATIDVDSKDARVVLDFIQTLKG